MLDSQRVNAQASGVLAFSVSKQQQQYAELPHAPNTPYVLIIDDDEAIVSVLLFLLESEQYTGVGLSDSKKVVPFLQQAGPQHLPSLILLDLIMPQLSGYEIAAALSQNAQYAHLPIIIMTADSRVRSASAVAGARDWIAKPFQLDTLLTKLEQYLSH